VRYADYSSGGTLLVSQVLPFSQFDREVLETARNKLIDMGGAPPELGPVEPPKGKGLNL
jgi:hypothetical protein